MQGKQANDGSQGCQCGTTACAVNDMCTEAANACHTSPLPTCSITNGATVNSNACQCDTNTFCGANTFCFKGAPVTRLRSSSCSEYTACENNDGSLVNSVNCACGATDCVTTGGGMFCAAEASTCMKTQLATCSYADGSAANNNPGACSCGTAICGQHDYCWSATSTCAAVPACTDTNAAEVNTMSCVCGTATCDVATGLFCTKNSNLCSSSRVIFSCEKNQGVGINPYACACGTTRCTAETGLRCTASSSTCAVPECDHQNGLVLNPGKCLCGAAQTQACEGRRRYCWAQFSRCLGPGAIDSSKLVTGAQYTIGTVSGLDWMSQGSTDNKQGTTFVKTGSMTLAAGGKAYYAAEHKWTTLRCQDVDGGMIPSDSNCACGAPKTAGNHDLDLSGNDCREFTSYGDKSFCHTAAGKCAIFPACAAQNRTSFANPSQPIPNSGSCICGAGIASCGGNYGDSSTCKCSGGNPYCIASAVEGDTVTPQCSDLPRCPITDGSADNPFPCSCGPLTHSLQSGWDFHRCDNTAAVGGQACVESTQTCQRAPCTNVDGTAKNSAQCICGTALCACTSSCGGLTNAHAGAFCRASMNSGTCGVHPVCENRDGSIENMKGISCACGSVTCTVDTGFVCNEQSAQYTLTITTTTFVGAVAGALVTQSSGATVGTLKTELQGSISQVVVLCEPGVTFNDATDLVIDDTGASLQVTVAVTAGTVVELLGKCSLPLCADTTLFAANVGGCLCGGATCDSSTGLWCDGAGCTKNEGYTQITAKQCIDYGFEPISDPAICTEARSIVSGLVTNQGTMLAGVDSTSDAPVGCSADNEINRFYLNVVGWTNSNGFTGTDCCSIGISSKSCTSLRPCYCKTEVTPCMNTDLTAQNAQTCLCNRAVCTKSSGLWCDYSKELCARGPKCTNTDGLTKNLNDCVCGIDTTISDVPVNCIAKASGLYCTDGLDDDDEIDGSAVSCQSAPQTIDCGDAWSGGGYFTISSPGCSIRDTHETVTNFLSLTGGSRLRRNYAVIGTEDKQTVGVHRLFRVYGSVLKLNRLRLEGGKESTAEDSTGVLGGLVTVLSKTGIRGTFEATHVIFYGGLAVKGGAINADLMSIVYLRFCTFEANKATDQGGAIYKGGGEISYGEDSGIMLWHVLFFRNMAANDGGAIFIGRHGKIWFRDEFNQFDRNVVHYGNGNQVYVIGEYNSIVTERCAPGTMTTSQQMLAASDPFIGCPFLCVSGSYSGNNTNVRKGECPYVCPPGAYCPAGSSVPIPCPGGKFGLISGESLPDVGKLCAQSFECRFEKTTDLYFYFTLIHHLLFASPFST